MSDDPPFLLDVSRLIWRRWRGRLPTGVDRVCRAYLRHFANRSQAVVQHDRFRGILSLHASRDLFALLEAPSPEFRLSLLRGMLRHLGRSRSKGRDRFYFNVGHTGLNSQGFRVWVSGAQVRPIYLVHDLIPITHPQYCRPGEDQRHRERMRNVLTTATGVIVNSRATLNDLTQFACREGLPMPPSLAALLGTEPVTAAKKAAEEPRPTFVTLGTIEGRKNHLLLLNIWSRLIDQFGSAAPRLLVIGQRGWEAQPAFDLLDNDEKLRGHVIELDRCSDEELRAHLAAARALLFPSFTEGYGLPLVEALAAGVPVVASDLPTFRELCGDIPTYLDPFDESAWEAAIIDYSRPDSTARDTQCARMKVFHVPTWDEHFRGVEAWLRTLD